MESKTIKGIEKEKWMLFKALAARKNMPMGKLFEAMVEDYHKRSDFVWNRLLKGDKILSDKEAREMEEEIYELRKEKGFRI